MEPNANVVAANADRWKNLLIFLTILNTIFAAVLAALQSDAGIRANVADRDSQHYAISSSGEINRSGMAAGYDLKVVFDALKFDQENLVLMMTALDQIQRGENSFAANSQALADAALAKAKAAKQISTLYTDARFAPKDAKGFPDLQAYLLQSNTRAEEFQKKNNLAADLYNKWNQKSDDYVMILTITSVAFLLFGVGQTLSAAGLRLFFAIVGGYIQFVCAAWMIVTILK